MKVTVTDRAVEEKVERVYPYWGIHKDGGIVLFIRENTGVKIKAHKSDFYQVGEYSNGWAEHNFTPLVNKTITIEV